MKKLLFLVFLVSCGLDTKHIKTYEVAADFQEYVDIYTTERVARGKYVEIDDLVINFGSLANNKYAICRKKNEFKKVKVGLVIEKHFVRTPTIVVDPDKWRYLSDCSREALILHELGHCIQDRDHKDDSPSVMSTYLIDGNIFCADREFYLDELIGKEH